MLLILIIVASTVPVLLTPGLIRADDRSEPADLNPMRIGARLAQYTPHVPVWIDGTDDFQSQGWPGSGTSDDPYVISGLNITYDIDEPLIRIWNTDAYFIVTDCVVNQISSGVMAVYLENVTHGTLDHLTVNSPDVGIYLVRANYTSVQYTEVTAQNDYALHVWSSPHTVFRFLNLTAQSYRAVLLYDSDWCRFEDVISTSHSSWNGYYLAYSSHVAFERVSHTSSSAFVYALNSAMVQIQHCEISGSSYGLYLESSPNATVQDSTFRVSSHGIFASGSSENVTVRSSEFYDGDTMLSASGSTDNVLIDNVLVDSFLAGVSIPVSYHAIVTNSEFRELTKGPVLSVSQGGDITFAQNVVVNGNVGTAVDLADCSGVTVSGNTFANFDGTALSATNVNYTTVEGNSISNVKTATDAAQCNNWTIVSNTVETVTNSIQFYQGSNVTIASNNVTDVINEGIYVDDVAGDVIVRDNSARECSGTGVNVGSVNGRVLAEYNGVWDSAGGLYFYAIDNLTVRYNFVSQPMYDGISIDQSPNSFVFNNTVSMAGRAGIWVSHSAGTNFTSNWLYRCGFYFVHDQALDEYRVSMTGNIVNGLPVFYKVDEMGYALHAWNYGQAILINCTYVDVNGGRWLRPSVGVAAYYSDWITVHNFSIGEAYWGIITVRSANITIEDGSITALSNGYGLLIRHTDDVTLSDLEISDIGNNGYAIYAEVGDRYTMEQLTILHAERMYFRQIDYATLSDSQIYQMSSNALFAFQSNHWLVNGCYFSEAQYGIYLSSSSSWNITGSNFYYMNLDGVSTSGSVSNIRITECYFEGSRIGVNGNSGSGWVIVNNTFSWHTQYGVRLALVTSPTVYRNVFVGNHMFNAYDTGSNFWDDGVSVGNWWDDYAGPGYYYIPGGFSVDRYPSTYLPTTPILSSPPDVSYAEGTEEYVVTWYAYDDLLSGWNATLDGAPYASGVWNFADIEVDVGGLAYGVHQLVLTVYDVDHNTVTDVLLINVYDNTAPVLDGPDYVTRFVGAPGQEITWEATDLHPANYTIYEGDSTIAEGLWTGDTVTYSASVLSEGDHTLRIVVRDIDLNVATMTTNVRMLVDNTAPTVDSPPDVTIYQGTAGAAVVWTASDDHPSRYVIQLNGTEYDSGPWSGGLIVLPLENLSVGHYEFTISVYDGAENSASDTVVVTVTSPPWPGLVGPTTTTGPTTTPPGLGVDPMLLMLAGGSIIGVIVVIAAVRYIRKRRAA